MLFFVPHQRVMLLIQVLLTIFATRFFMKMNKAPFISCLFFSMCYASSLQLSPGRYDLIISNNIDSPFPALNNFTCHFQAKG